MATATAGVIVGKVMFLITCDMQRLSLTSETRKTGLGLNAPSLFRLVCHEPNENAAACSDELYSSFL